MSVYNDLDTAYLQEQYDEYLETHIGNVSEGFYWLKDNLPELFEDCDIIKLYDIIKDHDKSKYSEEEYMPYAVYFYGSKKKTAQVQEDFDYAWLHHIHNNPHHWQYWVLVNDDDGTKALDMPYEYIIEMICDHWTFSWAKGNLYEIFDWYDKHIGKIVFSPATKKTYESILGKIKKVLDKQKEDKLKGILDDE